MSATYRAKVEHSILFAKIVSQYFQRQQFFFGGATSVVFTAVLNQGRESFTSQSERIFCSRWGWGKNLFGLLILVTSHWANKLKS